MKVWILATAAAVGIAAAAPSQAQTELSSFTGPRAEFFGGYSHNTAQIRTGGLPMPFTSRTRKHDGGVAGAQLGYDYQLGNFLVGAFGSYALETGQSCGTLQGLNRGCVAPSAQAEGGLRAGIVVRNFLVYGKGAYVSTRLSTNVLDGTTYQTSHINRDGYRAGAGAEYNLNDHFYVKAEYDYTRTNHFSLARYGFPNTRAQFRDNEVVGGFGIRF